MLPRATKNPSIAKGDRGINYLFIKFTVKIAATNSIIVIIGKPYLKYQCFVL